MLPLLALLVAAPPLDPEAAAEYRWRVAVRFDPPIAFAADFRGRVCKELVAALRPLVGEVGRCEVHDLRALPEADRTPLERDFLARGWAAFDGDDTRTLTGVKQHLVRVRVSGNTYTLEARQLDGSTGLASPVVRAKETRDPQAVGREAGLLVGKEFSPVGTVERDLKQPDAATVRFKGGTRPGFDKHVKAGDVFAVGLIREQKREPERDKRGRPIPPKPAGPATLVSTPQSYVLLRLEDDPKNGTARCKILSAYKEPLPTGRDVVGVRCLQMLTQTAPVAVRVVGEDGKPLAAGGLLTVRATDSGYDGPSDPRDGLELRDGVYRSARPLRGVACVVIGLGAGRSLRYPLPITGDGPVTLRFPADPAAIARAAFERECDDLRGRVAEAAVAFEQFNASLSDLIVTGANDKALVRADQGLTRMESDDKLLGADLNGLKADPLAADARAAAVLAAAERELNLLREVRPSVLAKRDELKTVIARGTDVVSVEKGFRAKELAARIKQLVDAGEVPEALDLYDQLFEVLQQPDIKAQKEKLAAEWKPTDAAHQRAREFVADTWRKLPTNSADIRAAADKLPAVVATLVSKEDRLGLRQLLASFNPLAVKLKELADKLDPAGEGDKAKRERLLELTADVGKLQQGVQAAVQKIEGAK